MFCQLSIFIAIKTNDDPVEINKNKNRTTKAFKTFLRLKKSKNISKVIRGKKNVKTIRAMMKRSDLGFMTLLCRTVLPPCGHSSEFQVNRMGQRSHRVAEHIHLMDKWRQSYRMIKYKASHRSVCQAENISMD